LLEDALALQEAGCFSIVLEAVPAQLAALISQKLEIPTIGIGAGAGCDGQVLVIHDLLGLFDRFTPRFVKQYLALHESIVQALRSYREDVEARAFPAEEHAFLMQPDEWAAFLAALELPGPAANGHSRTMLATS
jgi:3-methyl-2-oxobutanoate hydroxymethyltransferase